MAVLALHARQPTLTTLTGNPLCLDSSLQRSARSGVPTGKNWKPAGAAVYVVCENAKLVIQIHEVITEQQTCKSNFRFLATTRLCSVLYGLSRRFCIVRAVTGWALGARDLDTVMARV